MFEKDTDLASGRLAVHKSGQASFRLAAKQNKILTLCRGVEPRFRAHIEVTGACTNRYTNRDCFVYALLILGAQDFWQSSAPRTTARFRAVASTGIALHLHLLYLMHCLYTTWPGQNVSFDIRQENHSNLHIPDDCIYTSP